jgi:hypothetical protein
MKAVLAFALIAMITLFATPSASACCAPPPGCDGFMGIHGAVGAEYCIVHDASYLELYTVDCIAFGTNCS